MENQSIFGQIIAFYSAIDWDEPVLMEVVVLHLLALTIISILPRLRIPMLFVLTIIGLGLEKINTYASLHYKSMFKVNYFDKNGNFIVTLIGFPIILNILLILTLLTLDSFGMLDRYRKSYKRKLKDE